MRKIISLVMAIMLLVVTPSFAAVGIWIDGAPSFTATDIEFTEGVVTHVNGRAKFSLLLAGTANGGAATMTTTDTAISTSYSLVRKDIGVQVGLAGTLADGSPGQVLTIIITARAGSGTFLVTPTTKSGFVRLTFDAADEYATLLFVDTTIGWVPIAASAGVIVHAP